jgi:uridine kinase
VGIVGGSGAGKTWLSRQLLARLGKEADCLSQDDFYRDRSHLPKLRRDRVNFDHPRSIDWPALEHVLKGCSAGLTVEVPRYDFRRHTRHPGLEPWRPKPVVLVEGLWLLRHAPVRRLFTFSIYVDCSKEVRLRRRVLRDVSERGRHAADARDQFRTHVTPMHELYVAPQRRRADLVVRSPMPREALDRLAERILQL